MRRREYLISSAAIAAFAGCIGDEVGDEVTPTPTEDPTPTPADDDGSAVDEDGDDEDDETDATSDTFLPNGVLHHWPMFERTDDVVEDVIGNAHGEVDHDLLNVAGNWHESHAEEAILGSRGHIDLGFLDSVNASVSARNISVLATIWPMEITPDRPMTIFGAGGGGTNWFEFRITEAEDDGTGRLRLRVIDRRGNEVSAVADPPIEVGEITRVATSLGGTTGGDISFWIDGEPVDATIVVEDGLYYATQPAQSYGIFASNPSPGESSVGTRNWFTGTIDNVVVARTVLDDEDADMDYQEQPWI